MSTLPRGRFSTSDSPLQNQLNRPWPYLIFLTILDAAIVASGAFTLWIFGGQTVVSGPLIGRILSFLVCLALIGVRQLVSHRMHALSMMTAQRRLPYDLAILAVHIVLLAGVIASWQLTSMYLLGWFACFASIYFATGYWWQLSAVVASTASLKNVLLRLTGMAVGVAGIFVTAPVHGWGSSIVETVVVLVSAEILLATVVLYWMAALRRPDTAAITE